MSFRDKKFTERIAFLMSKMKSKVFFKLKKSSIPKGITEKIDFWSRNQCKNGKKLKEKKVLEPKIAQKIR